MEMIGDLASVISPPYDVISPEEQKLYYQKSPYNIIRLELGDDRHSDSEKYNKYTRAADALKTWREEGILFRENMPAFYITEHRFNYMGRVISRWGLTACVGLEDWDNQKIRPHESTLSDQILDRLHLLRNCKANLSPISGMLWNEKGELFTRFPKLVSRQPDLSVVDNYGVMHNMWIITDETSVAEINSMCANYTLYIVDGHHRYQTALTYKKEQQAVHQNYTEDQAFNFVMMTLVDAKDPGLVMLPTHRMVRLLTVQNIEGLKAQLNELFHLEILKPQTSNVAENVNTWINILRERGLSGMAIGLYGLEPDSLFLLVPREKESLQGMMPVMHSDYWANLDVSLLHGVILPRILGMDTPAKERASLEFTRDAEEALKRVDSNEFQLAFLLNPIEISSILAVADAGDRMPQKSTYFYPKPPTGMVMNPLY
jgi:uncharacterized protein (DUF1015 family)